MSGSWACSSTSASCSVSEASSKVPPQALDALDLGICALNQLFSHRFGLHPSSTRHRGGAIVSKSKVGSRKSKNHPPARSGESWRPCGTIRRDARACRLRQCCVAVPAKDDRRGVAMIIIGGNTPTAAEYGRGRGGRREAPRAQPVKPARGERRPEERSDEGARTALRPPAGGGVSPRPKAASNLGHYPPEKVARQSRVALRAIGCGRGKPRAEG
jgi:hypothetical protein